MTAGCARCGECCTRITLSADPRPWSTKALEGVPDPRTEDGWAYWREARGLDDKSRGRFLAAYDPDGEYRATADFVAAHWDETCDGHWTCDMFDPEAAECTAHESRPPVCSRYPWYGDEPSAEGAKGLSRQCSYLADLPAPERPEGARPLIPLTVLRG